MPTRPAPRPRRQNRFIAQAITTLNGFMALAYMAVGILFLTLPALEIMLQNPVRQIFGGLLMVYGLFRAWRTWNQWRGYSRKLGPSFRERSAARSGRFQAPAAQNPSHDNDTAEMEEEE